MGAAAVADAHDHGHHDDPVLEPGELTPGKFCMWLFLGSDAMGFCAFVCSYIVLRMASVQWVPPGLPEPPVGLSSFITFLLICSSVTMVYAYDAICNDDVDGCKKWLGATFLGGALFLVIQAYEWWHFMHQGVYPWIGPYGSTFYACTGYHGLHVLVGVIYIGCMWLKTARGGITRANSSEIEILGLYWHFVDLVWILLFTVIYLV